MLQTQAIRVQFTHLLGNLLSDAPAPVMKGVNKALGKMLQNASNECLMIPPPIVPPPPDTPGLGVLGIAFALIGAVFLGCGGLTYYIRRRNKNKELKEFAARTSPSHSFSHADSHNLGSISEPLISASPRRSRHSINADLTTELLSPVHNNSTAAATATATGTDGEPHYEYVSLDDDTRPENQQERIQGRVRAISTRLRRVTGVEHDLQIDPRLLEGLAKEELKIDAEPSLLMNAKEVPCLMRYGMVFFLLLGMELQFLLRVLG
jgi:hypothetical protein